MAEDIWSGDAYVPNYNFEVQLGLSIKVSFSKISGISSNAEYGVIADGGNMDRMYFFEKPKRKPDTLSFNKGLAAGLSTDILSLLVEGVKINDIMILVKRDERINRIFYIEQGILTKVSFSDLDAGHNEILVRTMELQHTGMVEIPV